MIPVPGGPYACIDVSFDIDQVSSDLAWNIDNARHENRLKRLGRFAGAVRLDFDDTVKIKVTAFARQGDLYGMTVLDAMLYTIPYHTHRYLPSPFSNSSATASIGQWQPAERVRGDTYDSLTHTSLTPLRVVQTQGRWQMSLVITVLIQRSAGDAQEVRVFSFDPETEIGTGTEPDTTTPARSRAVPVEP